MHKEEAWPDHDSTFLLQIQQEEQLVNSLLTDTEKQLKEFGEPLTPEMFSPLSGLIVDLARIELAIPSCEDGGMPLTYRPSSAQAPAGRSTLVQGTIVLWAQLS